MYLVKLKASYTVEGSAVISICMIIIGMCILLAFDIYRETDSYILETQIEEFDCPGTFRQIRAGKMFLEDLFEK